jgi:hypothetical protein
MGSSRRAGFSAFRRQSTSRHALRPAKHAFSGRRLGFEPLENRLLLAATVTDVSSPADNGSYKIGDTIPITVSFSEAVAVTDTPQLTLETGTTDRAATYTSGSGSTTLTFQYIVQAGDTASDLDYASTSALSGTIRDAATNSIDATLTLPTPATSGSLGYNKALVVDGVAPTATSITKSSTDPTSAATVKFLVTFSESVSGIDVSDFAVTASGLSAPAVTAVSASSGTSVTVTVSTGTGDGTLALTLLTDDTIVDNAGNPLSAGLTSAAYTVAKPPTATISLVDSATTDASSVDFLVTFTESVTGVDSGDFALATSSGISAASITSVSGSGASYTVTVDTGSGDGTLGLNLLDNGTIVDDESTALADGVTGPAYTMDRAPTVAAITLADSTPTGNDEVRFAVTFSESVLNVDTTDFALVTSGVTGAAVTSVSGSGSTRTVTVNTGAGSGTLQLNLVDDDTIEDTSGNVLGGSGTSTIPGAAYTIDKVNPGVTSITTVDANPTNAASVHFTVTFSESVTGVDTADFSVPSSMASVAGVTGSGTTWTVTVNVTSAGTLKLTLADNDTIKDTAGNVLGGKGANNYTDGETYTIDKTAPKVTAIQTTDTNPSTASSVGFKVIFDEAVTNVDITDFKLEASGLTGLSIASVVSSGDDAVWIVTVNTGSGTGTLELELIDDGTIKDLAGNQLGGSGAGDDYTDGLSYTVDRTTPTVSSIVVAEDNPTADTSVAFKVTFSESVTGVTTDDFAIISSALSGAAVTGVEGSGTTWTVTCTTGTGSGTLQLNLVDNDTIKDLAGVALGGSGTGNGDFAGEAYTIDKTNPAVSSIVAASTNPSDADSVTYTVAFSESVTAVDSSDFSLIVSGLTNTSITAVSGSGSTWTVTVSTGSGSGTLQLKLVDDDSIVDLAGNVLSGSANGSFVGDVYTIQKDYPTVSSIVPADTNPTTASSVRFTVTFSESVTGVDIADFALATSGTSGTIGSVNGSGTTWTVTVTSVSGRGTLGLNLVDDDSIIDADSNPLGGSGTGDDFTGSTYTVTTDSDDDTTAPTVSSIVTADTNPTTASSVRFTVTFSESVTGVDTSDFQLATSGTSGAISSVSGSGTTWTVTVTDIAGTGTLGLNLVDNDTIVDASNNALSGAFTGQTYTIKAAEEGTCSISGYVYVDVDNDGSYTLSNGGHHTGLGGVTIRLRRTDVSGAAEQVRVTKTDGSFTFDGLAAGTYMLVEDQPSKFSDGIDTAGSGATTAGTAGNDTITGIVLSDGAAGTSYNFGERGLLAQYVSAALGLASSSTGVTSINEYSDNLVVGAADTIGLYNADASVFYLRNTNTSGVADTVVAFGVAGAGWLPIAGDWNGDGVDSIGLYDPTNSVFYLRNSNTTGMATIIVGFGTPGASLKPVVGDWNGDGIDTVGLYDPETATFYLRNSLTTGTADICFAYGTPGADLDPVAGDWNGDGVTTVGVYDPSTGLMALTNKNRTGISSIAFFCATGATAVAGDWNGDESTTVGIYGSAAARYSLVKDFDDSGDTLAVAYGVPGNDWLAVVGQWTAEAGWESLRAAGGAVDSVQATPIVDAQLDSIVAAAIARWEAAGASQETLALMKSATVTVADLGDDRLGAALGNQIRIDDNAAGHGWYVDTTPATDEEFVADRSGMLHAVSAAAVDQIDLETVVMHELGHLAGLEDLLGSHTLMGDSLASGTRKVVGAGEVAAVFALDE